MKSIWLNKYQFWVYDPEKTTWHDVAGIYIFAGITPQDRWRAFYIGQAKSFQDRIPNHENWLAAVRRGATHVHAMVVPLAANRDRIEAELIEACQPALNVQLK
jgi:excinuclease UvrABC nuclease subunit